MSTAHACYCTVMSKLYSCTTHTRPSGDESVKHAAALYCHARLLSRNEGSYLHERANCSTARSVMPALQASLSPPARSQHLTQQGSAQGTHLVTAHVGVAVEEQRQLVRARLRRRVKAERALHADLCQGHLLDREQLVGARAAHDQPPALIPAPWIPAHASMRFSRCAELSQALSSTVLLSALTGVRSPAGSNAA